MIDFPTASASSAGTWISLAGCVTSHRATLCSAVVCASVVNAPAAALAGTHIPSIDISPASITSTSGNITTAPGVHPVNGNLLLTGSVHVPLSNKVIFSYDHITNGIIYATLPRVAIDGKYVYSTLDLRAYVENRGRCLAEPCCDDPCRPVTGAINPSAMVMA